MENGPNLNRRGFLTATGGISIAALLAACGGSDSSSDTGGGAAITAAAAPAGSSAAAPAAATPPKFDPATETGPRSRRFEWAGYEVPDMWQNYIKGPYNADVADEVHVPRERPAGAREGRLRRAVRPDPSLHRVLARLQGRPA